MTASLQVRVTTQATPAQPARPPASPDEISARIEEAVERAVQGAVSGSGRREVSGNLRDQIRAAIDQARAEAAARAQGGDIIVRPDFDPTNVIPPQAVDISVAFFTMIAFIVVGLPLARAFARRMDRRGATIPASEVGPRLDRIEQAIEAVAIEVERVSEGQRYTTKAISDLRGLPAPVPVGGWPAGAREAERVPAAEARRP
jgi:hypothetical protein